MCVCVHGKHVHDYWMNGIILYMSNSIARFILKNEMLRPKAANEGRFTALGQ